MDPLHDKYNRIIVPISSNLEKTIKTIDELSKDCADFVKRRFTIGGKNKVDIYFVYIDNMVDKTLLEEDTLKYLLHQMDEMPASGKFDYIIEKGLRSADISVAKDMDEAMNFIFGGDTLIFVDGYDKAIRVSVRGMASRGIQTTENEATIRGSKESFTEAFYLNRVLLRRRIKDANMKMKQFKVGTRTLTDVAMVYLDGVAKDEILEEVERKINEYTIDGIFDSGMLEQLMENNPHSPFPEIQATERPDKAASAIVEGRVVVLVDNSPTALIMPATLNTFFQ
ncbi:MAG: spore germination protein, partial [Clostridiales bacterium]|nr:spore germination protein [Clostridiales bacterium]